MHLYIFAALSLVVGLTSGFIFGCSHSGLLSGLLKGIFIGGILALDAHLIGAALLDCWLMLAAAVVGSIVATLLDEEHPWKRRFDFRRHLDL